MQEERTEYIASLFNKIAPKYDLMNRIMTLRIDVVWRKRTIRQLFPYSPKVILDIATGTGDLAIQAAKLKPDRVIGIDPANRMLAIAKGKVVAKGLQDIISFQMGSAEQLPFNDNEFDAITIAFGVRNFSKLEEGLANMYRVLKPKGTVAILETSRPKIFPLKQLHQFYFKRVLTRLGKDVSKNEEAYEYFAQTVLAFPQREEFIEELKNAGFNKCRYKKLLAGTACIYLAHK